MAIVQQPVHNFVWSFDLGNGLSPNVLVHKSFWLLELVLHAPAGGVQHIKRDTLANAATEMCMQKKSGLTAFKNSSMSRFV